MIYPVLLGLLGIDAIIEGFLLFRSRSEVESLATKLASVDAELTKIKSEPRKNSVELQEFLAALMTGKAGMFAVARIDPNGMMYRSPRSAE